jgi:hypothetical protein
VSVTVASDVDVPLAGMLVGTKLKPTRATGPVTWVTVADALMVAVVIEISGILAAVTSKVSVAVMVTRSSVVLAVMTAV